MKTLLFVFCATMASAACTFAANVPDPVISYSKGEIVIQAPEKHHFNKDAPNKVEAAGTQIQNIQITDHDIRAKAALKSGETASATTFLCDDAKSYCVRKKLKFTQP